MSSLCTPSGVHLLSLVSLVFAFAGSASLQDGFLHFLASAFSVTCFGAFFFWGGGGWHVKGFGVLMLL